MVWRTSRPLVLSLGEVLYAFTPPSQGGRNPSRMREKNGLRIRNGFLQALTDSWRKEEAVWPNMQLLPPQCLGKWDNLRLLCLFGHMNPGGQFVPLC